ncbi:MAG: N-acetylmuramoyl-L-alanine amidase, partial [Verrucomicrobiota bacterium]|nr:N-acetylmuramoyl-L-alanine amidase [Verrucomicrobiota bacterium]
VLALLLPSPHARGAANVSPLGKTPDWTTLEKYQETITHDEFATLLRDVYCTRGVSEELIRVEPEVAHFLIDRDAATWFTLRFAPNETSRKPFTTTWRRAAAMPKIKPGHELSGVKIALDPGHIGGRWAKMEERWFQVGDGKPVQEGDMTLLVAKLLAAKLRALGAKVTFVRGHTDPVTPKRPDDLREVARQVLQREGIAQPPENFSGPADPEREHSIRWESELLFYRNSEIRQRAEIVNNLIKPDVVLCLHFNAEAWDDPAAPRLVDHNHLHLLVNGSYLSPELEFDDVRFEMLEHLLGRMHAEEFPLAETAATAFAWRTHLPPYQYTTENVTALGGTGYVYARNLMATRLYQCPVVYYEPYVMNSDEVFWRVQEGDYPGIRNVNGTDRPSIFREYADAVLDGLMNYYRAARR